MNKDLSNLEKLKNRLIYLTTLYSDDKPDSQYSSKEVRKYINDTWGEIYKQLGKNYEYPLNDDDFLKVHWIMYSPQHYNHKMEKWYMKNIFEHFDPKKVPKKAEIATIDNVTDPKERWDDDDNENEEDNESIQEYRTENSEDKKLTLTDINTYLSSLQKAVGYWYDIHNIIRDDKNNEYSTDEITLLDRLDRVNSSYFKALILALYVTDKNIEHENKVNLLRALYRRRAKALYRKTELGNLESILKGLQEHCDQMTKNRHHINKLKEIASRPNGFYEWYGIKYFLFEYEGELRKKDKEEDYKIKWAELHLSSIEHIYPQAPKEEWEAFRNLNDKERECYKHSLGNLLPLPSSKNISLSNKKFEEKKEGYRTGSYQQIEVSKSSNWTPEEIVKRGKKMLEFMEKRWNIKLGNDEEKKALLLSDTGE